MLKRIYIKHFAIIEEVEIQLEQGLCIITGETGAGKSILLDALSLCLGERAHSTTVAEGQKKAIVEIELNTLNPATRHILKSYEFDFEDELIIRREISAEGKNRVFINDTPATLKQLLELGKENIHLHRQFENIEILDQSQQLELLDTYCSHTNLLQESAEDFLRLKQAEKDLKAISEQEEQQRKDVDYYSFLVEEIDALQLKEGEIEKLEQELRLVENDAERKSTFLRAADQLDGSESSIAASLRKMIRTIDPFVQNIEPLEKIRERMDSCRIELEDMAGELTNYSQKEGPDTEKTEQILHRVNEANRLFQKHRVNQTADLIHLGNEFRSKLMLAEKSEEEKNALQKQIKSLRTKLLAQAEQLSATRQKKAKAFSQSINEKLSQLGISPAHFEIRFVQTELRKEGFDEVLFLFDPNQTGKPQAIQKIASGGEISRLMLVIKSILADYAQMPTLIFDEIDSGISGETAIRLSDLLQDLSSAHQLIAITHLPQIASRGIQHWIVEKSEGRTKQKVSRIRKLSQEERGRYIAQMIGGKNAGATALKTAQDLLAHS